MWINMVKKGRIHGDSKRSHYFEPLTTSLSWDKVKLLLTQMFRKCFLIFKTLKQIVMKQILLPLFAFATFSKWYGDKLCKYHCLVWIKYMSHLTSDLTFTFHICLCISFKLTPKCISLKKEKKKETDCLS